MWPSRNPDVFFFLLLLLLSLVTMVPVLKMRKRAHKVVHCSHLAPEPQGFPQGRACAEDGPGGQEEAERGSSRDMESVLSSMMSTEAPETRTSSRRCTLRAWDGALESSTTERDQVRPRRGSCPHREATAEMPKGADLLKIEVTILSIRSILSFEHGMEGREIGCESHTS